MMAPRIRQANANANASGSTGTGTGTSTSTSTGRPDPGRRSAGSAESSFGASALEWAGPERPASSIAMQWRRRLLATAALVGCLAIFWLARLLVVQPTIDADWQFDGSGAVVLLASPLPALADFQGQSLLRIDGADKLSVEVDARLFKPSARWLPDDERRQQLGRQLLTLSRSLQSGPVVLRFESGSVVVQAGPRGYSGLGLLFWLLAAAAMLVYLFGVVQWLARPRRSTLLFVAMCVCQALNLALLALETVPGPGNGLAMAALPAADLNWRGVLEITIGAATLHAWLSRQPRTPAARTLTGLGWTLLAAWIFGGLLRLPAGSIATAWAPTLPDGGWSWLTSSAGAGVGSLAGARQPVPAIAGVSAGLAVSAWWQLQATLGLLALVNAWAVQRTVAAEPDPYARVIRRFVFTACAALAVATALVAVSSDWPAWGAAIAEGVAVAWALCFAAMLMLAPALGRSRELLREFALLAGISTVATALDLAFVTVFALGAFTSLAIAVFISLALYGAARQLLLDHLLGRTRLTTERMFEQLYRAARAVQARPEHYVDVLSHLLEDLFEPLQIQRVERSPGQARVVGGGAVLVVPLRPDDDADDPQALAALPIGALALRYARRGERLFTLDDARLADRLTEQLRQAVAHDRAVERGRLEERQRIAQDLHDDIGARLLTLMYQAPTPELEDYIRHTLQDLKTLTRGLAASEHRLSHAAAEWKSDLTQRLNAAQATLAWSCSAEADLALSVVEWSALTRVLRELVSNALFHGHSSRIEVAITHARGGMLLQVTDDGEGQDPSGWAHGLGLGGVRKRVKLLGGTVEWRRRDGPGIVCTVRLPAIGAGNSTNRTGLPP